jgi:hypothetical protein
MVVYEIETYLYKDQVRKQKAAACNMTFKGAAEDLLLMLDNFGKLDDVNLCVILYWGVMDDGTHYLLNSWHVSADQLRSLIAEVVE